MATIETSVGTSWTNATSAENLVADDYRVDVLNGDAEWVETDDATSPGANVKAHPLHRTGHQKSAEHANPV